MVDDTVHDEVVTSDAFTDHMTAPDAVMWDIEKDPVLRSTITAVAVLDRAPDWERLRARVDRASRLIPRLRQRVVVPPLRIGPPRWVVDPHFDLDFHLRRVRAPGDGSLRAVLDTAQPIAMEGFDRARPLWSFTLVEGLADGRAALIQKLHHSMTDGVGGIELALTLLDDRRLVDEPPMPPEPRAGDATPSAVFVRTLRDQASRSLGVVGAAPGSVLRAVTDLARSPATSVRRTGEVAASLGRLLAPVPEPASPIMRDRSLARRFDTLDVPLAALKDAGHASGGTLNDAFVAAAVGGLARYHDSHGSALEEVRLTMPVSFRQPGDPLGSNRFAPLRFAVPATVRDPVERMRVVGDVARRWQHEPALAFTDGIAFVLDRLPVSVTTSIFGGMLKHIDAVVTNVPGFPSTCYLAGAELERQYAFAPPSGAAVNIALLSHRDLACVGVVSDVAAVPDHDRLLACLAEGFDEVLATSRDERRTA